jgi:hypothetical protein
MVSKRNYFATMKNSSQESRYGLLRTFWQCFAFMAPPPQAQDGRLRYTFAVFPLSERIDLNE